MAGQTPALQQNWQSSEKSQHFKKNTIFNEYLIDGIQSFDILRVTLVSQLVNEQISK